MKRLVELIRFATKTVIQFVAQAALKVLLVRLPPRNYYGEACSTFTQQGSRPVTEFLDESRSEATLVNSPLQIHTADAPERQRSADFIIEDDFSFCAHSCSPKKPGYFTPTSESIIDMAILKAASDRISEILQEHRRRVDAGEDPCVTRKEARRRRTQELVLLATAL